MRFRLDNPQGSCASSYNILSVQPSVALLRHQGTPEAVAHKGTLRHMLAHLDPSMVPPFAPKAWL